MFGYIRYDTPYLFIKDQTLYNAVYCGVCKGIKEVCGEKARFFLSYDSTFLAVMFHNLLGVDVDIEKSGCFTHVIRKKPMAKCDDVFCLTGAINTVLAYYKCLDDIEDEKKGGIKAGILKKAYLRAKKQYPELDTIVKENLLRQSELEKSNCDSLDRAADATATMLAEISDFVLKDKKTDDTHRLFYSIGKWVYLIDALDDMEKDSKKGLYNPFLLAYGVSGKQSLTEPMRKEIEYVFHSIFYDVRSALQNVKFHFNRDLTDNILLRGLPKETKRVLSGETHRSKKPTKENKTTVRSHYENGEL